jgi:hypothetical protein
LAAAIAPELTLLADLLVLMRLRSPLFQERKVNMPEPFDIIKTTVNMMDDKL